MKQTGRVAHAKAQRRKGELRGRVNAASSIAHAAWHAKAQRRKGELRGLAGAAFIATARQLAASQKP